MTSLSDFSARSIDGRDVDLSEFDGRVVLVVNTASQCGFTPQFEGLQRLHERFGSDLVVLGFPCDQFANQELDDDTAIAQFCQRNYGVTFPMFSKVDVNGDAAHPLFVWLKEQKGGRKTPDIKWNFTKFLIGRDGRVVKRFSPTTEPEKLADQVERVL